MSEERKKKAINSGAMTLNTISMRENMARKECWAAGETRGWLYALSE